MNPDSLGVVQNDVPHCAGLVSQDDHIPSPGLGEVPGHALPGGEATHFWELLVDFFSGIEHSALGHVFLRVGEHELALLVDLWLADFVLAPEGELFVVEELDGVEEVEGLLVGGLDSDEDGPLDEGGELVFPSLD